LCHLKTAEVAGSKSCTAQHLMPSELDHGQNKEGGKIMSGEDKIIQDIRKELRENADEQHRQSIQRFFKERSNC